jgi:hypothetical protein
MKALFSCIFILIAIVLTAGLFFYFRLPSMASTEMSKRLQVAVSVQDITLRPNLIAIDQIDVANLPGGRLSKALSVQSTQITAPLLGYLESSIVIEEIALDQVYLGLEFVSASGTQGNWSTLMGNLNREKKKETSKTKVFIKKLILTNIRTDVVYDKDGKDIIHLKPIDRIELTNISSEEGISTSQIMNTVLGQMLKSVFTQENLKNMLEGVLQEPSNPWNSLVQPFKNIFGN